MAEAPSSTEAPATSSSSARPNVLTRKLGPLQTWQWAALIGLGGGVLYYVRNRATGSSSSTDTSSLDSAGSIDDGTGDGGLLGGVPGVGDEGPAGPAGPPGKQGEPGTAPPVKTKPKPGGKVGTRLSSKNYPAQIYGLTSQGKSIVQFATVKNGSISGKNVGKSGAPVYALINTVYGPVWEQYFDPRKVPNGTKVGTLPQFKNTIKAK